jgi:SpoVK/Ycf46/Vps4 family AAA+-type ATPase
MRGVTKRRRGAAAITVGGLAELARHVRSHALAVPHGCSADKLASSLEALDAFVGAAAVKSLVVDMVLLVSLGLQDSEDFTNVVVTGNPGTGKTEMLKCIAGIWALVFHGKRGRVTWLSRAHLVGEHLGETAIKTARALSGAAPGVVVLDEVYALGSGENDRDSFSKECIDTINQFTSECREHVTVIVAGYKAETDQCFFARNRGLDRRFPWRFHIDDYSRAELVAIAETQLARAGWAADGAWASMPCVLDALARGKNNGGDTQRLLQLCKLAHARRVPCAAELRTLSDADVRAGCAEFVRTAAAPEEPPRHMYS